MEKLRGELDLFNSTPMRPMYCFYLILITNSIYSYYVSKTTSKAVTPTFCHIYQASVNSPQTSHPAELLESQLEVSKSTYTDAIC